MDDYAYHILYNEEYSGWFYSFNLGATTIWEIWNSLLPNGTIIGSFMNSFNIMLMAQFVKLYILELWIKKSVSRMEKNID